MPNILLSCSLWGEFLDSGDRGVELPKFKSDEFRVSGVKPMSTHYNCPHLPMGGGKLPAVGWGCFKA